MIHIGDDMIQNGDNNSTKSLYKVVVIEQIRLWCDSLRADYHKYVDGRDIFIIIRIHPRKVKSSSVICVLLVCTRLLL